MSTSRSSDIRHRALEVRTAVKADYDAARPTGGLRLRRDGLTLVFDREPALVLGKAGEPIGVDAWLRLYDHQGNEIPIDPHRVIVNPPQRPMGSTAGGVTGQSKQEAFYASLWDSVLSHPHGERWAQTWRTGKGTVTTVFANPPGGNGTAQAVGTVYADARAGSSGVGGVSNHRVGQNVSSGLYFCWESFLIFETSSIPDGDEVTDVSLQLYGSGDNSSQDFTIVAASDDYDGGPVASGDWVPGADLSAKTTYATFDSSGMNTSGYNSFVSAGSAFNSAINKSGDTAMILYSSRLAAGNQPSTAEHVIFLDADEAGTTQDPKLVITHASEAPDPRTVSGAVILADTFTSEITASANVLKRVSCTVDSDVNVAERLSRDIAANMNVGMSRVRDVPSDANLDLPGGVSSPSASNLFASAARVVASGANVVVAHLRTIPDVASIADTFARLIASAANIAATNARAVPVAINLFWTTHREIPVSANVVPPDPEVSAVDPPAFYLGQTVTIHGANFGEEPGTVELSDNPEYGEGTLVEQTPASWSQTEIEVTIAPGDLDYGPLYLFVTRNPTSDPFPVTLLAPAPLPPLPPTPSPEEEVALALSGLRGTVPSRVLLERRTLDYLFRDSLSDAGAVIEDARMTLSLDNDRAVLRAVRGIELRASALENLPGGPFDPTSDNIAIIEERLIDGEWVQFPQGLFRLELGDTRSLRDGEPIIECDAYDLSSILTESGPTSTYTIAAGTNYGTAIETILTARGLVHSLDPVTATLPVDQSWPRWEHTAGTSWWQIIHDLADGLNYHTPWPNAQGRFIWAPLLVNEPEEAVANVEYTDADEPRLIEGSTPYRRRQNAGVLPNICVVLIDNPFHPDYPDYAGLANNDPASPISRYYRPDRVVEVKWDSSPRSSRCILDEATALAMAETILRREASRYYTATLTTLPDPRRGAHEYYHLTLTHPDGSYIEQQSLWRVASWSRDLATGQRMTHDLERVEPWDTEYSGQPL